LSSDLISFVRWSNPKQLLGSYVDIKADSGNLNPFNYKLEAWKALPKVSRHSVEGKNYKAIFSHNPTRLHGIAFNKIGIVTLLNFN
jgi:hypothetical protein